MFLLGLAFLGCAELGMVSIPSDAALKASVLSALQNDRTLDLSKVDVDVNSGTVTVSGLVDSQVEKKAIKKIVYHVRGVSQPIFNLLVRE